MTMRCRRPSFRRKNVTPARRVCTFPGTSARQTLGVAGPGLTHPGLRPLLQDVCCTFHDSAAPRSPAPCRSATGGQECGFPARMAARMAALPGSGRAARGGGCRTGPWEAHATIGSTRPRRGFHIKVDGSSPWGRTVKKADLLEQGTGAETGFAHPSCPEAGGITTRTGDGRATLVYNSLRGGERREVEPREEGGCNESRCV